MIKVREWGEWGEAMGAKPKFARRLLRQSRFLYPDARNEGYKVQLMRLPEVVYLQRKKKPTPAAAADFNFLQLFWRFVAFVRVFSCQNLSKRLNYLMMT